jgi:hypothetical protein
LLKSVNVRDPNILVSFNVVSLFTNFPLEEVLDVIRNELLEDDILAEQPVLEVDAIRELL